MRYINKKLEPSTIKASTIKTNTDTSALSNTTNPSLDLFEQTQSLSVPIKSASIKIEGCINDDALMTELYHQLGVNIHNDRDSEFINHSKSPIQIDIGVDEVGRGPLYGSVVVSAVILPTAYSGSIEDELLKDTQLAILTDSKKLTEARRERLFPLIEQQALAYLNVDVPASVIDDVNILQATLTGMRLACEHLMIEIVNNTIVKPLKSSKPSSLSQVLDNIQFRLLIDGNKIPSLDWQQLASHGLGDGFGERVTAEAWVKGDSRHTAIAAASVLAKVTRDRQMVQDSLTYPNYGLDAHKGYPTKQHIDAINRLGVLPQHRRSFKPIKEALAQALK